MKTKYDRARHEAALRAYERAHARWMNTSIWAPNAAAVKSEKDAARHAYEVEAYAVSAEVASE